MSRSRPYQLGTQKPAHIFCRYCGDNLFLQDNAKLYGGRPFGKAYICENYPACDTYVGVHKGTTQPLGTPANAELREIRRRVHASLDPIWQSGKLPRSRLYRQMAALLYNGARDYHTAWLDIADGREALALLEAGKLPLNQDKKHESANRPRPS